MFCPSCGAKSVEGMMFCTNCGAPIQGQQEENHETPKKPKKTEPAWQIPEAAVPVAGRPVDGAIAGLGKRILAAILDMILIGTFYACVGSWIAGKYGGLTAGGFQMEGKPALIAISITMLFFFLYYWLLEGLLGATVGKVIMGVEVRRTTGESCGLFPSFTRNLLRFIDALFVYLVGFVLAVSSKEKQRLGDRIAKTVVVNKSFSGISRLTNAVVWFAMVVFMIAAAALIQSAGPGKDGAPFSEGGKPSKTLPAGELKISTFDFLENESGPPRSSVTYKPGEQLYCRYVIAGYGTDPQGLVNLKLELVIIDPTDTVMYTWQGGMNRKLAENQSATGRFNIKFPYFAPPGTYRIHVRATDTVKGTANQRVVTFKVDAPKPKVSKKQELYDFMFAQAEGGQPINPPVFQQGQTVYMTAKLAGMQFDNDKINVRVAFQLIGPKGEVLLDKPDFLSVNDTFKYHPPVFFLPISARVTPPSGYAGVFTGKFTVNDLNRNSSESYSVKFEMK